MICCNGIITLSNAMLRMTLFISIIIFTIITLIAMIYFFGYKKGKYAGRWHPRNKFRSIFKKNE